MFLMYTYYKMNILEKLKSKPIPQKSELIAVKFNQSETNKPQNEDNTEDEEEKTIQEVEIDEDANISTKPVKTKAKKKEFIIDRLNEKIIDKSSFFNKITKPDAISSEMVQEVKETIDMQEKEDESSATPSIAPKKIKRKLKLNKKDTEDTIEDAEVEIINKRRKPRKKIISEGPITMVKIGNTSFKERLPSPSEKILIQSSAYYLNNREIFQNFINSLFLPYKEELDAQDESSLNCESRSSEEFNLLIHQKLVRDYINIYTPYRGLLLYHGLGSGKTCSSIAIAEGIKSDKEVIVMTPASLRANYIEELKKCGDQMYKKTQHWEFVDVKEKRELVPILSNILKISQETISRNGGAFLVNIKEPSNFDDLSTDSKRLLDEQLNEMIKYKYRFINYNGMRLSHLREISSNFQSNPFSNKVIIIDEAHNFISRIVNKLNKPESLPMRLYQYLMSATNVKIVFLSGTPIINYPNEIAVMFNILRGYIKTWNIPLNIRTTRKVDKKYLQSLLGKNNLLDYMDYQPNTKMLTITRNPFGFINFVKSRVYKGVTQEPKKDQGGNMSDNDFEQSVFLTLQQNEIEVVKSGIKIDNYKALPDKKDDFQDFFVDLTNGNIKNKQLFQKRILGLTSYFRSAQEQLMPRFDKSKDYRVIKLPMSNYQFGEYEKARVSERKLESQNAKKRKKSGDELFAETVSTYRIFSRAFCNFVFPNGQRPMPKKDDKLDGETIKKIDEDAMDAVSAEEKANNTDGLFIMDDVDDLNKEKREEEDESYENRIKEALKFLKTNESEFLVPEKLKIYSPKFLAVLQNLQDDEYRGLHLIYSQFRTLEGIGIISLILEANGFVQFKIKKEGTNWKIDIADKDKGKPSFALYTGTETTEEKEILRNIYNSTWNLVPESIVSQLRPIASNNMFGEIIKVFMITASGAEGISLRNTRYVHIIEPYWHPVRVEQVIGRARRICSHQDLPEKFRSVEVFLYVMTFDEKQLQGDETIELRLKDRSKVDNLTPLTTDEALLEIMTLKEQITSQILNAVKEASIDCTIHAKSNAKEGLKCFSFGKTDAKSFSYYPSLHHEESDETRTLNKTQITWKGEEVTIEGKKYIMNNATKEVYDYESFMDAMQNRGDPILVGVLELEGKNYKFVSI